MNDFLQNIYLFIFFMQSKTNDNDNVKLFFFSSGTRLVPMESRIDD